MANDSNQDSEWDPASFYFSQLASMACEGFYQAGPLESSFSVSIDL
jgi:hypothetical protein